MLAAVSAAALAMPAAWADAVDDYVNSRMKKEKIPGLALAVLRRGRIVKARGYGRATLEHEVPVRAETIFQSGSVGKQFTAAAVMMLVEDGKLGLDDSIRRHLDGAPRAWKDVTVRHLLTHTSGIADYTDHIDLRRDLSEEDHLRSAADLPFEFAPGEHWRYSNTGYLLLGIILSRVGGRHWGEQVRERIFEPLGMKTARVMSESEIIANRASGYVMRKEGLRNQEWVAPSLNTTGDGALYFSVLDMAKWDAALNGDKLLTRASLDTIWTPVRLNDGTQARYGFGWRFDSIRGHRIVEHSGGWQGFSTHISRYPDDGMSVIVLTNLGGAPAGSIAHQVAGIYEPALKVEVPVARRLPEKALEACEGEYAGRFVPALRVKRQGDRLAVRHGEGEPDILIPVSETEFVSEDGEDRVEFVRGPDGRVGALRLHGTVIEEAVRTE